MYPSEILRTKKIALGFDGYIDSIVRIVKTRNEAGDPLFFDDSMDFGDYVVRKANKNFSLELEQTMLKVGGNMPITANAFARLGCRVDCIGALGHPDIHHIFQEMSPNCRLYSYAEPGMSTAVEFGNSKMMMAESTQINKADWSHIRETVGVEQLVRIFSGKDLVGLLNWSEVAHSTEIWKGVIREILPQVPVSALRPIGLFDLSDCSKKTDSQLLAALELLGEFSRYWDVILSLNMNESASVYRLLMRNPKEMPPIETVAKTLFDALKVGKVVVHHATEACCADADGATRRTTPKLTDPRLLTGAGDNFNTGFCAAMLLEMGTGCALEAGHRMTGHYISTGESPLCPQVFPE